MIRAIPLTVVPLIAYNLVGYTLSGADPWARELISATLPSGSRWSLRLGDAVIVFAIVTLFVDMIRAAGPTGRSAIRHALSMIVLAIYLIEFVAAGVAAHSVFFILTVLAIFDVVAGASISIARSKQAAAFTREMDEDQ